MDEVKHKIIRLMGKILKNIIFEERSAESLVFDADQDHVRALTE
jgi:hypothetical protein